MNRNKHIWEGWTVGDFIDHLEIAYKYHGKVGRTELETPFKSKDEIKEWCKSEQPYYKKHIPEVYKYFLKKSGL